MKEAVTKVTDTLTQEDFQETTTILNARIKNVWKHIVCTSSIKLLC